MIDLGLRGTRYDGIDLPPQAIPTKEKKDPWKHACMDSLENIGSRQISENHVRFDDSYRIVQGDFKYTDVVNSSLFLSEVDYWRNQADLNTDMTHYGFIEPIVNQLVGEYIKKPNSVIIDANDPLSTNDYIRAKTERLWGSVSQQLEERILSKLQKLGIDPNAQNFSSPEEEQAYQQQIQQVRKTETPVEIERDMNQNWRAVYIDWAEMTLEDDYNRFDIDEIDRDCLTDYMIAGRCFKHFRVGYDYYYPERWHPKQTFCDLTQRYVEEGDYVGYIDYISPNKVIANYGHLISEKDKVALTSSKDYKNDIKGYRGSASTSTKKWAEQGGGELHMIPHQSYYAYKNAEYLQNETGIDLGHTGIFPNGNQNLNYFDMVGGSFRTDLIKVVEAYWVSQQKVGYLTIADPEGGEPISELVTDEILPQYLKDNGIKKITTVTLEEHEAQPEPNTIVWDYIPQVWKGVKICADNTELKDDLYVGVEPLMYQLKGESQTYHTRLPVAGLVEHTSFVSRLEEDQKDYNIARNAMRDYAGKELGVFYLMDFTYLPTWLKDMGGEDSLMEIFDIVKELGILPADGSNTKSRLNQFTATDMDLTKHMMAKLELSKAIKYEALEKVGLNLPRMGAPVSQETATGIEQSVSASYAQTETWFDKFSKFQKRSSELHLNVAQYMKKEGIDGSVNYVDSDKMRNFINMSDPYLPMRRFRITLENNSKRRSELELIKQVYLNDNTIDKNLEAVAEVVASDSISKIKTIARKGREIAEMQQQQANLQEQEMIKLKEAAETERETIKHQFEMQQIELKGKIDLHKQAILAMGFAEDKDMNNNGVPDVIEEAKLALEELKTQVDINNKDADRLDKQLENERTARFKQAELDLKAKDIEMQKYKADKTLEVARENQTKAEISKNKKKD